MKAKMKTALVALALIAAPAIAAEPPADPGRRGEAREWCRSNPDQCREKVREHMQEFWKRADADGDGAVSRSEAEANAPRLARHFDQLDADGDGRVTQQEMQAARERHREQRGRGEAPPKP